MPFARFPIPTNSSLLVPHSSLKSSPLPIHPSNSSHQIPHILYIKGVTAQNLCAARVSFRKKKQQKGYFSPFRLLYAADPTSVPPLFRKCPSTLSLHLSLQLPKSTIYRPFYHSFESPSKVILRPSEYHPKAIRKTTKNHTQ